MTWYEPLDLEYWFVQVLAGNQNIFIFLSFFLIASMSAYFRMLNTTTFIMFILFAVMMSNYITGIYFIIVLLVGLVLFYYLSRIVK
jgi:hypothetical protein